MRREETTPKPNVLLAGLAKPEVFVPLAAFATFALSIGYGFTSWDDGATLVANPNLRDLGGLARIWFSAANEQYYPLTWTSYWIEHHLWGLDPHGYHAVNVVLHAVNAVLALRFLLALGLSRWAAGTAALLFAVHPLQVMTVAWVAERKNLLSTLFALLTLTTWLHFRRDGRRGRYGLALACFAAALAGKTVVILLPIVLAAIDRCALRRSLRRSAPALLPMIALAALSAWLTVVFERKFVAEPLPVEHRPLIAAAGLLFYLYKLALPIGLLPLYPRWEISLGDPAWWVPLAVVLGAAVALWRTRRRVPGLVVIAAAIYLVPLVPVLGFVNFGNLALTFVSDHYVYLPALGPFLLLGAGLARWREARAGRRGLANAAVAVVAGLLVAGSLGHLPVFRDATAMWTATLAGNPSCFAAHFGLAQEAERERDLRRAATHYRAAAASLPDQEDAWLRLGEVSLAIGDPAGAEAAFGRALRLRPDLAPARLGLGAAAESQRRFDDAEHHYLEAIALDPASPRGHLALAHLFVGLLRREEAAEHFAAAMAIAPEDPWPRVGLATCRRGQRRYDEALAILGEALAIAPDSVPTLNLLARILGTVDDDRLRNGEQALALAGRAAERSGARDPDVLDTLAAALAENGRFEDAVAVATQAADLAARAGSEAAAGAFRRHADLYRSGRPLREATSAAPGR